MPNWCSNTLTLSHEDPAQIRRAADAFQRGELLQELVPNPSSEWNYEWSCEHWGTKWDVGGKDYSEPDISDDGRSMTVNFDSAWAPPTAAYDVMLDQGFDVEAMYYEPGCAFAGIYSNGSDDNYDLTDMDSKAAKDALPPDLDDWFAISETMAEYEDEEPLTEWYIQGAKDKGLIKDE
jgi:hypothetical protein